MKSENEIVQAHKRTIEVFTGKECTIILTDKYERVLQTLSLTDILLVVENYNTSSHSILSSSRLADVVLLRKIFCLLTNIAGYSAKKTGTFLGGRLHTSILYLTNSAKESGADENFTRLFKIIQSDILAHHEK